MIRFITCKCYLYGETIIAETRDYRSQKLVGLRITHIPVDLKSVFRYG